jgi:hypothetical protein
VKKKLKQRGRSINLGPFFFSTLLCFGRFSLFFSLSMFSRFLFSPSSRVVFSSVIPQFATQSSLLSRHDKLVMALHSKPANNLKSGDIIVSKNDPLVVLESTISRKGKTNAFVQVTHSFFTSMNFSQGEREGRTPECLQRNTSKRTISEWRIGRMS